MNDPRHITVTLVAGLLTLGLAGCGGGSKHSSTATTASTTPAKSTGKQPPAKAKTATKTASTSTSSGQVKSKEPPLSETPAKTLTFSGSGVKDIGKPNPLRIPTNSTIEWTNTGAIFQIIPASIHVASPVNSTAHSGTATIRKGAYYGFLINAIGNWTVKIIPGA
jgi:hypothetical protein